MRPVVVIPESKRLNSLLKEFRDTHQHMAIVVDEYGELSGLVTMEDVIEQIVGNIEDEYDLADEIYINQQANGKYIVKGTTPIEVFNQQFHTQFDNQAVDTIAGLIVQHCGHLPKRHEVIDIPPFHFKVLHTDQRRISLLEIKEMPSPKSDVN